MKRSTKQAVCGLLLLFLTGFALGAAAWLYFLPWGLTDGLRAGQSLRADQIGHQILGHRDTGAGPVNASLIFESPFDEPYPERGLWKLFGSADDFKPGWLLAGGREVEFIADQGRDLSVGVSQGHGLPFRSLGLFLGLQSIIHGDVAPVASMFFDEGYQPLQLIHLGSVLSSKNGAILLQFSEGSEANQFAGPILQRDQPWQDLETGQPELILIFQTLPLAVPVKHPGDAIQGPKALAFFHQLRIGVIDPLRQDWDGRLRIGEHQRAFDAQFQFSFQRSRQHKILPLNGHRMLIGYRGRKRGFRSYGDSIHVVCNRNRMLSSSISNEVQA